jgi:type IV pilus assembly protein PilY1
MNKRLTAFHRLALSTLSSLLVLHSAVSYADDTEIFFGGSAISDDVRPNVLFVLDNSGSMAWRTASNDSPNSGELSRLSILKSAFSDLITNASNLNAGVMVLNQRAEYGNSRMAYPVTNIDNTLPSSTSSFASQPEILESGDDASQISGGTNRAIISDPTLPMGYFAKPGSATMTSTLRDDDAFHQLNNDACSLQPFNRSNNTTCRPFKNDDRRELTINEYAPLLLFRSLDIPASANITSATLTVTPTSNVNYYTGIYAWAEQGKTPSALNDNSPVNRNFSTARQITAPAPWSSASKVNLDVTQELKSIQGLNPASSPVQSALLRLFVDRSQHSSDRTICMRTSSGCAAADLPTLTINYSTPSPGTDTKSIALRFQNVGIPRGATITEARIDFVPAASNTDPLTLKVQVEPTGDASIFTNTTDLTTRAKTLTATTWNVPNWSQANPPAHIVGPDVSALVQEVVNLSSWCGNNAMAFHFTPSAGTGARTAVSLDGAPGQQPTLTVKYTGGTGGCLNPIIEARVSQPKNDAWENDNSSKTVNLSNDPLPLDRNLIGARYDSIPVANGAEVLDARVILTPHNSESSPSLSLTLNLENSANSAQFTASSGNLSNRSQTTNRSCTVNKWNAGIPFTCASSGLASDLQSIFAKSGWTPGNAISLFLTPANDSNLDVRSYENTPAESITLRIKLRNGGLSNTTRTVRQELNSLVQSMFAQSGTPVVPTLNEAVDYYRGQRSGVSSPMTSACQPNHLVLLTDGQANSNTSAAKSSIASLAGACSTSHDDGEICGRELTDFIYKNDLNSSLSGNQNISVHTIGFALDASSNAQDIKTFLKDLASPVSPESTAKSFYTATNSTELNQAFNRIIQSVLSVDTTFVSPGATVNQFNRQSNKNEVYFALFKPSATNRWVGNLKRYGLNSGSGDIIIDADNVGAIDTTTGFFKTDARSFWTPTDDGNNTAQGGVANRLPAHASRKAYTYLGTSPITPASLTNSTSLLNDANTAITQAKLGAADAAERTALINWIRGLNDDGSARNAVGDPLHSVPRLVTYKCNSFTDTALTECASEEQSVFVGTNEGFVHAFDTNTGDEQMAFMPESLLSNIKTLKANATTPQTGRQYGMDNTVAIWVNDLNRNGVIYGGRDPSKTTQTGQLNGGGLNSGEFVYAYATMGRGGRNLYSLDVTDINAPKMRWFITPSTPGFSRLGQTWSTPVITKIDINGSKTPVLIFAGGYDDGQDEIEILNQLKNGTALPEDTKGNAIYIVNALTGALIWSGSSDLANVGAQSHQQLSKMRYSIPSSIRAIDLNRDGLADQFFVGDMGGQVWRFFINNGSTASGLVSPLDSSSGTTGDGVFASVIPADTGSETTAQKKAKLRRFYNEPDVALLTVNAGKSLVVNIGSGYRGHPLDTGTEDRFYSFRTPIIGTNASHTILTESAMYDATLNLVQEGSATQKGAAAAAFDKNTGGWFIRMENSGEKVLAEATTFAGQIFFNTYEPNSSSANSSCKAVQGTARSYAVNLFDATPPQQRIVGSPDRGDRSQVLLTAGIPPKTIIVFRDGIDKPDGITGTEADELDVDITVGPTYWIDEL